MGKIIEKLNALLKDDNSWSSLPHDEDVLAKMVLFNLRIDSVIDLIT